VPDKVFASGALGHGIGLISTDARVLAPIEGTVVTAMASGHAYGIKSDKGSRCWSHRNRHRAVDGRGFKPSCANAAKRVHPGDLLAEVDLDVINEAGYDQTTVIVITNTGQMTSVQTAAGGTVEQGKPVLTVQV